MALDLPSSTKITFLPMETWPISNNGVLVFFARLFTLFKSLGCIVNTISYSSPPQKTRSFKFILFWCANLTMSFTVGRLVITNFFLLCLLMSSSVMASPSLESIDEEKYLAAFNPKASLGLGLKNAFLNIFADWELVLYPFKMIFKPAEE